MSGRKFWVIALAVWMLLYGLLAITNVRFEMQGFLMGVLALIVAFGVFLGLWLFSLMRGLFTGGAV